MSAESFHLNSPTQPENTIVKILLQISGLRVGWTLLNESKMIAQLFYEKYGFAYESEDCLHIWLDFEEGKLPSCLHVVGGRTLPTYLIILLRYGGVYIPGSFMKSAYAYLIAFSEGVTIQLFNSEGEAIALTLLKIKTNM